MLQQIAEGIQAGMTVIISTVVYMMLIVIPAFVCGHELQMAITKRKPIGYILGLTMAFIIFAGITLMSFIPWIRWILETIGIL